MEVMWFALHMVRWQSCEIWTDLRRFPHMLRHFYCFLKSKTHYPPSSANLVRLFALREDVFSDARGSHSQHKPDITCTKVQFCNVASFPYIFQRADN